MFASVLAAESTLSMRGHDRQSIDSAGIAGKYSAMLGRRIYLPQCLFAVALCLTGSAAHAKHIYQYTDKDGVVHFTDVKRADATTGVKSTLVRAEARALVRAREDGTDEDRTIVMVNEAGGPVTADIELEDAQGVRTEPKVLPARVVLPAQSETRVLHVVATHPATGFRYRYKYTY